MNISVIFTGGTIGSTVNTDGFITTEKNNPYRILEMYRKLVPSSTLSDREINFKTYEPYNILSENLGAKELNMLFSCIKNCLKDPLCDGIIITHGSDTLQYTAALLGYIFGAENIPIVLIASNYPLSDKRANGLLNFSSAVNFISGNYGKGVFVSYSNNNIDTSIHYGTRLMRHTEYSSDIISIENKCYGIIKDSKFIRLNETADSSEYETDNMLFNRKNISLTGNSSSILRISPYVGMVYPCINESTRAVLFDTYHSGTLKTDESFINLTKKAREKNIPCFITGVPQNEAFYETVKYYYSCGITILPVSSGIAMYCKLWLALSCDMPLKNTMLTRCNHDFPG